MSIDDPLYCVVWRNKPTSLEKYIIDMQVISINPRWPPNFANFRIYANMCHDKQGLLI